MSESAVTMIRDENMIEYDLAMIRDQRWKYDRVYDLAMGGDWE